MLRVLLKNNNTFASGNEANNKYDTSFKTIGKSRTLLKVSCFYFGILYDEMTLKIYHKPIYKL